MTREQHLEAACRAGQIARIRLAQAVSDHPFDNDQHECAETGLCWSVIAAHHARAAQTCARCGGDGGDPDLSGECCQKCDDAGWLPRAEP